MDTPIADFLDQYAAGSPVRLHMPGHKGRGVTGPESMDITEIPGADILYEAGGIIARSETHAAGIFGTGRTLYSTEGATLPIRAMLYLVRQISRSTRPVIAAGRNSHISLYTGAALTDIDIADIYPGSDGYITPRSIREAAETCRPDALYLTSPDYEGRIADIRAAAEIARGAGIPLLVDNAHGAYLKFLAPSLHPIDLGAAMTADSAHKTLPVLTGGAYLHIAHDAPGVFLTEAERAMRIFASTSPSYLILRSLDTANRLMSEGLTEAIRDMAVRADELKRDLASRGWRIIGDEPLKLTLDTASYGYGGDELSHLLARRGIYAEAADGEELIMMFSAYTAKEDLSMLKDTLWEIKRRPTVPRAALRIVRAERAMSMKEALMSRSERTDISAASGRVLAEPISHCPPGVPIALPGEIIGGELIKACRALGIINLSVVT